jgi:hypothetical protein
MLVELAILLSSCSTTGAALGICSNECPTAQGASYTICAERNTETRSESKVSTPKPQRLCSYYVNGTIDEPTASVITAWVAVGSRLCIGDAPPAEYVPVVKTAAEQVREAFTAYATRPFAYLDPSVEAEIAEPVSFGVHVGGGIHRGALFGSAAEIRFVSTGVIWKFSDGQSAAGQSVVVSFEEPQFLSAIATVSYRIDYRYLGSTWVLGASSASLDSNTVSLEVIDPPRRSLLRD